MATYRRAIEVTADGVTCRLFPQHLTGDDQPLDLVGALADGAKPLVAVHALDSVLPQPFSCVAHLC